MSEKLRHEKSGETQPAWQFWAVFAFAAAIRLFDLGGKQLWLDEIIQAIHTSPKLSLAEVLRGVTQDRGATPLDYIIQHYVAIFLGQSEFVLRLHAAIFGTLTVAALYFLFRKLLDSRLALLAAALYAVYPLHHHYSQEGRPYALFVLLTVCSYLAFCRVLERRGAANWILYCLVNALLLYSQYFGAVVLFSQFVFSLTHFILSVTMLRARTTVGAPAFKPVKPVPPDERGFSPGFLDGDLHIDRKLLIVQACTIAISFLLLVPWIFFGFATISGYQPQPVQFGFKLFLSFVQELGDGSHPLAWMLIFLAILGARKLMLEKRLGLLSWLVCWCVLPVPLIFLLLWIKDYFFAIRHFLFITPALFALVALGIARLAEMFESKYLAQRTTAAAFALLAAVSLLVIGLHVPDRREDLRGAGKFLSQNVGPEDIVVAPQIDGVLAYYFPQIVARSKPVAVLNDAAAIERARRIFVVKTAYTSATDNQKIDFALQGFPPVRRIRLREVEIFQIPGF